MHSVGSGNPVLKTSKVTNHVVFTPDKLFKNNPSFISYAVFHCVYFFSPLSSPLFCFFYSFLPSFFLDFFLSLLISVFILFLFSVLFLLSCFLYLSPFFLSSLCLVTITAQLLALSARTERRMVYSGFLRASCILSWLVMYVSLNCEDPLSSATSCIQLTNVSNQHRLQ
jgi:hypothetical protein